MTDAKREKCPMCAEDVEPGAKFCPHCGTQFQVSRSGYCSACLDVVEVGINDKCSRCGGDLADIHRVRKPVESVGVPARLAPAGGGPPPAPGTSALVPGKSKNANLALLFGILSLFVCGFVLGFVAISAGKKAIREIAASGGLITGRGRAVAGVILGIVGIIGSVIALIVIISRQSSQSSLIMYMAAVAPLLPWA